MAATPLSAGVARFKLAQERAQNERQILFLRRSERIQKRSRELSQVGLLVLRFRGTGALGGVAYRRGVAPKDGPKTRCSCLGCRLRQDHCIKFEEAKKMQELSSGAAQAAVVAGQRGNETSLRSMLPKKDETTKGNRCGSSHGWGARRFFFVACRCALKKRRASMRDVLLRIEMLLYDGSFQQRDQWTCHEKEEYEAQLEKCDAIKTPLQCFFHFFQTCSLCVLGLVPQTLPRFFPARFASSKRARPRPRR